jgi:hypothetical protein
MRRRLFRILAVCSTLLFVMSVGIWIRSYWVGDVVWIMHRNGDVQMLRSSNGNFTVHLLRNHLLPGDEGPALRSAYDRIGAATAECPIWHAEILRFISGSKSWSKAGFSFSSYGSPVLLPAEIPCGFSGPTSIPMLDGRLRRLDSYALTSPDFREFKFQLRMELLRLRLGGGWVWIVGVPWWGFTIVTGIGPLWIFGKRIRSSLRASDGHCAVCGYDLRATPDRCPECGTSASSPGTPGEDRGEGPLVGA